MDLSDSSELRALIEQVTVGVLQKYQTEPVSLRGKLLVFCDTPGQSQASLSPNSVLWKQGMALNIQEVDAIEISSLSVTSLAKLVHFIWDTPFLSALGEVLLSGASVRVTDPRWKNGNPWKKQNGKFSSALSGLVETGKSFGIQFEDNPSTKEMIAQQKVITQEDVLKYHEKGIRSVVIPAGCIVTPLALEIAKARGISFRS